MNDDWTAAGNAADAFAELEARVTEDAVTIRDLRAQLARAVEAAATAEAWAQEAQEQRENDATRVATFRLVNLITAAVLLAFGAMVGYSVAVLT